MSFSSMIGRLWGAAGDDEDTGSTQDMPVRPVCSWGECCRFSPTRIISSPCCILMPEGLRRRVEYLEQAGPSAKPILPPLEIVESEMQEVLANPNTVQTAPDLSMVAERIQAVSDNVDVVAQISDTAGSIASSSHRLSARAVQLLEQERKLHECEKQKFEAEISALKSALKKQMEVLREAVSAI